MESYRINKSLPMDDWNEISRTPGLEETFMEEHWGNLNKECVLTYQHLSETFMDRHWEELYKSLIPACQRLSEAFMDRH